MKIIRLIFILLLILIYKDASAFLYGEHKQIGDSAFSRFIRENKDCFNFFKAVLCTDQSKQWKMTDLDFPVLFISKDYNPVTFGEINGLSGDHALQPIDLFLELKRLDPQQWFTASPDIQDRSNKAVMPKILSLHRKAISKGNLHGAGDISLTWAQHNYPCMAIKDSGHFYLPELNSIDAHLQILISRYLTPFVRRFNYLEVFMGEFVVPNPEAPEEIKFDIDKINAFLTELYGINCLAKYSLLHTVALSTMDLAAIKIKGGEDPHSERIRLLIQVAVMFEGYACHFIQDAFAAGHLCVHRSAKSALNNQGKHDYYNRAGQEVENMLGDRWTAYGDGFLDSSQDNKQRAIEACENSLKELWNRYQYSMDLDNAEVLAHYFSSMDSIEITQYMMNNFKSLQLIPKPLSQTSVEFKHSQLGPASSIYLGYLFNPSSSWRIGYTWEWNYLPIWKAKDTGKTFYEYKISWQVINLGVYYNFKEGGFASSFATGINFFDRITLLPASWYWNIKTKTVDCNPACTIHFKSIKKNWTLAAKVGWINSGGDGIVEASGGITYYF